MDVWSTSALGAQAVSALHRSLLGPFQRWREHTNGIAAATGSPSAHGLRPLVGHKRKLRHTVDVSAPAWVRQETSVEFEEVALYLLVWGEAANLRFMPELIFLLFELARAYVSGGEVEEPAAPDSFLLEVVRPVYECVFRETFAGLDETNFRPKPLPASRMERYPKNYDDWSEACWSHRSIAMMTTHAGGPR